VTKSRIREWSGWLLKEAILTPVAAWIGAGVLALLSPAILLLAAKWKRHVDGDQVSAVRC